MPVADAHTKAQLPPVALDVRLPPLHPKVAAQLQFMAAGHSSLFAGKLTHLLFVRELVCCSLRLPYRHLTKRMYGAAPAI